MKLSRLQTIVVLHHYYNILILSWQVLLFRCEKRRDAAGKEEICFAQY